MRIIAILTLLILAVFVSGCTQQPQQPPVQPTGNVKEVSLQLSQFKFEPATITVNKGDTVKLSVTATDVPHGFSLPEFGVSLSAGAGETKTTEFVADKSGTFTFRCNTFCGEGHPTMTGTLIVE